MICPVVDAQSLRVKPEEVCLVPENRMEVTTEGGLDVAGDLTRIRSVVIAGLTTDHCSCQPKMNHALTARQLRHRPWPLEKLAHAQNERRKRGKLLMKSAGPRIGNARRKQNASVWSINKQQKPRAPHEKQS